MESIIIIVMLSIATLLFILSFFKKDRNKQIETQIENLSITLMQEIYQLKKKIKVLEEELLLTSDDKYFGTNSNQQVQNEEQIIQLYEQGYSLQEIAERTSVASELVEDTLTSYIRSNSRKGFNNV